LDTVEFFSGMFLGSASAFANARTHLTDFDSDVGKPEEGLEPRGVKNIVTVSI
jgi:hypothetical protein